MPKARNVIALSFTESEYIALSSVAQELLFLINILERYIDMFEGNDGACKLVRNATGSTRTKHIDVRHNALRDLARKGDIDVVFVGTPNQRADALTKNFCQ
ncbi:unnamed protein product [Choristocarpus tenellus]